MYPPPMNREETLSLLRKEPFDILVIGGGATGTGIALEGASRGLRVALVERGDFACGTSSRSTKLVHGGVRYLEQAILKFDRSQFNLVRDALHERATLVHIAPHLVRVLPIFTPVYRSLDVPYYLTGLKLYDRLAGKNNLRASYFIRSKAAIKKFPHLKSKDLRGGVIYFDGQFDDARMNISLALTAQKYGAAVANYLEVTSLTVKEKKVTGAVVTDTLTSSTFEIKAKAVLNAAGPFVDEVRALEGGKQTPILTSSSGVHLVLDASYTPGDMGLLIPKTEDGRVLFVLPWLGRALLGTTDNPAKAVQNPEVSSKDVSYLLRQLGEYYSQVPRTKDILSKWSGFRPLVADTKRADTARLSRDHIIHESPLGLFTVAGGKWTTYRKMGVDAVDHVAAKVSLKPKVSCTENLRLVGGEEYRESLKDELKKEFGLSDSIASHLSSSYGDRAPRVATMSRLLQNRRLSPKFPYLEAEVHYGVQEEGAITALDVLIRRTRLACLDQKASLEALPRVIELMAERLSWDKVRRQEEFRKSRDLLS